jgi:hypothetical protein
MRLSTGWSSKTPPERRTKTMKNCVHPKQWHGGVGPDVSCHLCNTTLTKKQAAACPDVCPGSPSLCAILTCPENEAGNCQKAGALVAVAGGAPEECCKPFHRDMRTEDDGTKTLFCRLCGKVHGRQDAAGKAIVLPSGGGDLFVSTAGNDTVVNGDGAPGGGEVPQEDSGEGESEGIAPETVKCGNKECEDYRSDLPDHCGYDAPDCEGTTVEDCAGFQRLVNHDDSIPGESLSYSAGDEDLSDVFMHPLPVFLTDVELGKYSQEQARLYQKLVGVKELKKAETARYNGRIKGLEEQLERISGVVEDGTEERPVECRWVFNYSAGEKRLVRLDDGKEIERKNLTVEEIQAARQPKLFPGGDSVANVEKFFGQGAAGIPVSELADELAPGENKNYSGEASDSADGGDPGGGLQEVAASEGEKPVTEEIS